MRSLTSIESSTNIIGQITAHIAASDASTTWVFSEGDLSNITPILWEVPYTGGLGKTSSYEITLSTSLGWIKDNLAKLPRSEVTLDVIVNSDQFYPHVGRIRQIKRNTSDPNIITCKVYDRFLDTVPKFPVESLVESYTTLHPKVIDSEASYPLYYGKHTRPFFFTPVDCNINSLLGPRNVSSANHVNSLFVSKSRESVFVYSDNNIDFMILDQKWDQQSGGTNAASSYPFYAKDIFSPSRFYADLTPVVEYGWNTDPGSSALFFDFTVKNCNGVGGKNPITNLSANVKLTKQGNFLNDVSSLLSITYTFSGRLSNAVDASNHSTYMGTAPRDGDHNISLGEKDAFTAISCVNPNSGDNFSLNGISLFNVESLTTNIESTDLTYTILNQNSGNADFFVMWAGAPDRAEQIDRGQFTFKFGTSLRQEIYRNYSIFALPISSSDIANTENPNGILFDVFSAHTTTPFVIAQNSTAQIETTSYNFQCGFYEREPLDTIIDDFGKITGTYAWLGDSGMINFRTYQESANLTDSSGVNFTITPKDMNTFSIKENPLGASQYISGKYKRIRVKYGYDFSTRNYDNLIEANPQNTNACNSIAAAGIDKEKTFETKYILESDTASYYLGNLVRRYTNDETIVNMSLPARFFQMEATDVLKIKHPMLIGSESLFQVTKINNDFLNGRIDVEAQEIINL